jgi:hypothetical protein
MGINKPRPMYFRLLELSLRYNDYVAQAYTHNANESECRIKRGIKRETTCINVPRLNLPRVSNFIGRFEIGHIAFEERKTKTQNHILAFLRVEYLKNEKVLRDIIT